MYSVDTILIALGDSIPSIWLIHNQSYFEVYFSLICELVVVPGGQRNPFKNVLVCSCDLGSLGFLELWDIAVMQIFLKIFTA